MSDRVTAGDALVSVAAEDPSALKLIGDLMEYNAHSLQRSFESLWESEKFAHERTRERLGTAKERLALIERRVAWLFGEIEFPWEDEA